MNDAERIPVLRLLLDLSRILADGVLDEHRHATHAGDLMLLAAVFIGGAEGKPMTAAKLAVYAGLARPTAVRKLRDLHARGVVQLRGQGGYVLAPGIIDTPKADKALRDAVRRIVSFSKAIPP